MCIRKKCESVPAHWLNSSLMENMSIYVIKKISLLEIFQDQKSHYFLVMLITSFMLTGNLTICRQLSG